MWHTGVWNLSTIEGKGFAINSELGFQKHKKANLKATGHEAVVAKGRQACLDVIRQYFIGNSISYDYITIEYWKK